MPYQVPKNRVYTVISGVFYIGLGSVFDEERLQGTSEQGLVFRWPPRATLQPRWESRAAFLRGRW